MKNEMETNPLVCCWLRYVVFLSSAWKNAGKLKIKKEIFFIQFEIQSRFIRSSRLHTGSRLDLPRASINLECWLFNTSSTDNRKGTSRQFSFIIFRRLPVSQLLGKRGLPGKFASVLRCSI